MININKNKKNSELTVSELIEDNLSIGERIYCLLEDLKDLSPDIPDYIIEQVEELNKLYNEVKLSDNIDVLEIQRFYKDYCKDHNIYDLAQEIGISETSLRKIVYGYHVGEKVLEKCHYWAKKFTGE